MVKIQVRQIEKTYIPKYYWYKHGKIEGVTDWFDIDEEDEQTQVLDPSNNTLTVSEKKLRDYDALGLSLRRKS